MNNKFLKPILKVILLLGFVLTLVACSPMTDGGGVMNDMMDNMRNGGMKGNMMDDGMGENMMGGSKHSDDHESSSSHSYLPFTPLSADTISANSVYHPGSITELQGQISDDGVREFKITATLQPIELKEGFIVESWAYNGKVPGPLLRDKEGERVRIILENEVPGMETAIHWHGLLVPNTMDGVPPITQPYVSQGERFIYEFIAQPSGTFWYHAHSMGDGAQQLDRGLLAPIVIEPKNSEGEPKADREWIVTLDEWQVEGAGTAPPSTDGSMMNGDMMEKGMMNNHLLGTADGYNVFTINGRAHLEQPFVAEAGEWVRLRLLNGGFQQHRIHVHGMKAWVTHTDGHLLPVAQPMDELVISPYERLGVLLYGTEPGEYMLHDHNLGHRESGMQAKIKLNKPPTQSRAKRVQPYLDNLTNTSKLSEAPHYQKLIAGIPGPDKNNYDRHYKLTIGMEMGMGSNTQP